MRSAKRRIFLSLIVIVTVCGLAAGAAGAASSTDALFGKLRTVFNLVQAYDKDGADADKFVQGAIKGGLEALGDPYTNYFSPTDYKSFTDSLSGSFSGIGAYLDQDNQYVIVASPIKDSPAEKAGLKTGDRILEVDGVSLVGASTDKASTLIRGNADTDVTLKVERPSEQRVFTVTITRAQIVVPQVDSKMLDPKVGYIQISSFGDNAVTGFYSSVDSLKKQGVKSLVLDLRQNPGGYLDAAVKIASAFVPVGKPVVWQVTRDEKTSLNSEGLLINLPVVVLVDGGSASATEILTGAIQDYGIGPVVGVKTFGKGTVQELLNLSDGSGMKVTIAEFLTAKEHHVHGIGITPDYVVEKTAVDPERAKPLEFKRFLTTTSVGLDVLYLQYHLQDMGFDPDVDGFWGVKTDAAVTAFARQYGLPNKPIVDAHYIDVLNQASADFALAHPPKDVQLEKALELARAQAQ